jgi:hypothetical protein
MYLSSTVSRPGRSCTEVFTTEGREGSTNTHTHDTAEKRHRRRAGWWTVTMSRPCKEGESASLWLYRPSPLLVWGYGDMCCVPSVCVCARVCVRACGTQLLPPRRTHLEAPQRIALEHRLAARLSIIIITMSVFPLDHPHPQPPPPTAATSAAATAAAAAAASTATTTTTTMTRTATAAAAATTTATVTFRRTSQIKMLGSSAVALWTRRSYRSMQADSKRHWPDRPQERGGGESEAARQDRQTDRQTDTNRQTDNK